MSAAVRGTVLVTGANGGLGSAISEQISSNLELSAYYGLYTVRDATRTPALTSALAHSATHSHEIVAVDLTKLDSVRQVAEGINVSASSLVAYIPANLISCASCYSADTSSVGTGAG